MRFQRLRNENNEEYVNVHDTEMLVGNTSIAWNKFQVKSQKFCNGDYRKQIKLFFTCGTGQQMQKVIGETKFVVNDLIIGEREFRLQNKENNEGVAILQNFNLIHKPSFLEYIIGGIQLNLILAVDFTASNGDAIYPNSLHYLNPNGSLNQYQSAISSVGEILLAYDYDKQVPCFGFGGKLLGLSNQVLHVFPLNGNINDPYATGLNGIMESYQNSMQKVTLSGPTYFNPLLQEISKVLSVNKQGGSKEYTILLILTDGEIHDMKSTIDTLLDMYDMPVSIIIVGIGDTDFSKMVVLDGDEGLYGSSGQRAQRDLVQFVPFKQMQGNSTLLARHVLAEIPSQVTTYYESINIMPQKVQQHKIPEEISEINEFNIKTTDKRKLINTKSLNPYTKDQKQIIQQGTEFKIPDEILEIDDLNVKITDKQKNSNNKSQTYINQKQIVQQDMEFEND